MKVKYIYSFGGGKAEGRADMKELLGGKGANLAEMTNIGLPVPPGFTISTEACNYYLAHKGAYPRDLKGGVIAAMGKMEKLLRKKFGDDRNPLLVSVRSGARASMPGMMDTILNLGLNDKTVEGFGARTKNERFVWDSYRRLIQMYGDVVLGLKPATESDRDPFEIIIERVKHERGVQHDTDLNADDLRRLAGLFKDEIRKKLGVEFPQDPREQLWGAINAVFNSWNNDRAIAYRRMNEIPAHWG